MKMNHKKTIVAVAVAALSLFPLSAHAQTTEQAVGITPSFTSTTRTECTTSSGGVPGWLGQALGGVVGAGVGSQIGKGSGQSAAAAAGAVLGAQAGAAMSSNQPAGQTCRDITERTLHGYTLHTSHGRDVFLPSSLVQSIAGGR